MILKTWQQWFKINGKNAFGCPLRLGLYLKEECMNLSDTNFSRTAESHSVKDVMYFVKYFLVILKALPWYICKSIEKASNPALI